MTPSWKWPELRTTRLAMNVVEIRIVTKKRAKIVANVEIDTKTSKISRKSRLNANQ